MMAAKMSETTNAVPNPGSEEAALRGCTCGRLDNHHGKGYHGMPGVFIYTAGCPVHWPGSVLVSATRQKEAE